MSDNDPPEVHDCHVGNELHLWNVKGSERVEEGGCIPFDPKYFFKINSYVKPDSDAPVTVREEERNSISIGLSAWHENRASGVGEGIALWAERMEIVKNYSAPGVPGEKTGGYIQFKIAELPDTLYIELSRHDPWTDTVSTHPLSCPRTLDFADPLLADVLESGVAPCKYRLVGAQVGELRKNTSDDQYVTWWGYVWDDNDGSWREMPDKRGTLRYVKSEVVFKHLDNGTEGKTFPTRLYYRKLDGPELALPPMPRDLIDFDAPRTCIKVPCSGPWERIPWGPDKEPWGDASAESCTLSTEIVRHPEHGSYGVFYVHLHVVVSYPGDPEPAFNRNLGNRGDMYIVTCFDTEFGGCEEPEDAILDVDREPWPEESDGTPIPARDPRIPKWAKGWHDMESYGMPIPERHVRPAAIAMAHLKHARWNMLRERFAELYNSLHGNIHRLMDNRAHAACVMKAVNKAIAETEHHHMCSHDKAALLGYSGNDTNAYLKLPMPRTVQALSLVVHNALDAADVEANKFGYACGARPNDQWFADVREYEFDAPARSLCCTMDDMIREIHTCQGRVDMFPFMGCTGTRGCKHLPGFAADAPDHCPRVANEKAARTIDTLSRKLGDVGVGPKVAAARDAKKVSETAADAARAAARKAGDEAAKRLFTAGSAFAKSEEQRIMKWVEEESEKELYSIKSNDFDDFTERVEKQLFGGGRPRGNARDQTRRDLEWMKHSEAEKARKAKKAAAAEERAREANSSMRGRHQAPTLYTERLNKKRGEELREEQQRKQEEREQAKAAAEAAAKAALKEKLEREKSEAEAAALGKAQEEARRWAEAVAAEKAAAEARALAKEERKAARRLNRKKTPAQLQAEADAAAEAKHEAEMAEMVARVQKTLGITLDPAEL